MKRYTVQANQFNLIEKLESIEEKGHSIVDVFPGFLPNYGREGAFVFLILADEPFIIAEQGTKLTDEHA